MKHLLLPFLLAMLCYSCSEPGAKEFNQKFTSIENAITQGQIDDFDPAIDTLNGVIANCKELLSQIEFETDEESVREAGNLRTIIERIETKIASIEEEKLAYDRLQSGGKDHYEMIKDYGAYMANYSHGIKKNSIKAEYTAVVSDFIDGFSDKVQTSLASLSGEDAEPTNNLFQLVSYANDKTYRTDLDFNTDEFDTVHEVFSNIKNDVSATLSLVDLDIITTNGNSPQSLKQQFDQYENGLSDARKRQEETVKGLIDVALRQQDWEQQANYELQTYIARRRVGRFACNAYDLSNKITQAEDYQINVLSSRVEIMMKYNVSSFCATDIKYRYYQGTFNLVYPVIRGKLGVGYFKSRSIKETT